MMFVYATHLPSAEKRQPDSLPGEAVRRRASPPARATSQMSPAKVKQMSVALRPGSRISCVGVACANAAAGMASAASAARMGRRNDNMGSLNSGWVIPAKVSGAHYRRQPAPSPAKRSPRAYPRTSRLYLIRCGVSASAPFRRCRSAS